MLLASLVSRFPQPHMWSASFKSREHKKQQTRPRALCPGTSGGGSAAPLEADLLGWPVSPFVRLLRTARLPEPESETPSKEHNSLLLCPHSFWAFLRLPQNGSSHPLYCSCPQSSHPHSTHLLPGSAKILAANTDCPKSAHGFSQGIWTYCLSVSF